MDKIELLNKLQTEGFPSRLYSLEGELKPDSVILYQNYSQWEVLYLDERGNQNILQICDSEDSACRFLYMNLKENLLLGLSPYFSKYPVWGPHVTLAFQHKGELETMTQIWFDSIIESEKCLPSRLNTIIFEIEYIDSFYRIKLFGTSNADFSSNYVRFSVDYCPMYDFMIIKPSKIKTDIETEFANVIQKYLLDGQVSEYKNFFSHKFICLGFRDKVRKI